VNNRQFYDIIEIHSKDGVREEVDRILGMISPRFRKNEAIQPAFLAVCDLFEGKHPLYQACNTRYHDLRHTTDVVLATARLIHGAFLDGVPFTRRCIHVGIVAALLHDVGYLQEIHDTKGTGAKHTQTHVQRSMAFAERHGSEFGFTQTEIHDITRMILSTDIAVDPSTIEFRNPTVALLGKILAVTDIVAQMADRIYLEKLLYLYEEFAEADIGYPGEVALLHNTLKFAGFIARRLDSLLPRAAVDRYFRLHFGARFGIRQNLYHIAVNKQIRYLETILRYPDTQLLNKLKRGGIVAEIQGEEAECIGAR
jgi:hypothetical protein